MPLLKPDIMLRRISQLTPQALKKRGIKALILDVDNTLTTHNNREPHKDIVEWLGVMRKNKIHMVIVSNNNDERVRPFAKKLDLPYISMALKPLTFGFYRAAKIFGFPAGSIAVVGDQIFTDILGGNLFGAVTVLVEPMEMESGFFFRAKRKIEKAVLKNIK